MTVIRPDLSPEGRPALSTLEAAAHTAFADRHIGLSDADIDTMLATLGYESLDALMTAAVPKAIRLEAEMLQLPGPRRRTPSPRSCARWRPPTGRARR